MSRLLVRLIQAEIAGSDGPGGAAGSTSARGEPALGTPAGRGPEADLWTTRAWHCAVMPFSRRSKPEPVPEHGGQPLAVDGVQLPPGRPVVADFDRGPTPTPLWITDAHPRTGLWPLVLTGMPTEPERPWSNGELDPVPVTDVDAVDAAALLAEAWRECFVVDGAVEPSMAPFGPEFPGLQPALPGARAGTPAAPVVPAGGRLGLVRCSRPADAVALVGWLGAVNVHGSAQVAAVLRSWEERYGAVVAAVGFDTLTLVLPHPPVGPRAEWAAAEIVAFCPDALWQSGLDTVGEVAAQLAARPQWDLWFD